MVNPVNHKDSYKQSSSHAVRVFDEIVFHASILALDAALDGAGAGARAPEPARKDHETAEMLAECVAKLVAKAEPAQISHAIVALGDQMARRLENRAGVAFSGETASSSLPAGSSRHSNSQDVAALYSSLATDAQTVTPGRTTARGVKQPTK